MVHRLTVALPALLLIAACTHNTRDPLTYSGPSPWADQILSAAVEAYPYAQMSYNAYSGTDSFDLGPDYSNPINGSGKYGFAYSVFERRADGALKEVILALRGTQPTSPADWLLGNAAGAQNALGLAVYDKVREPLPEDVKFSVTGHSLGGAIATFVSLRGDGVNTYAFNSSPRFWRLGKIPENRRLSIVERGEWLKVGRLLGREAPQTYISINCIPGADPIGQHAMRLLAQCLTQIAAWDAQGAGARQSLNRSRLAWPTGLTRD